MKQLTTREEKLLFVKSAIEEIKNIKLNSLLEENTLLYSLELDSLDVVELQLYYEEQTGKLAKDPTTPVLTAGQLIDLME